MDDVCVIDEVWTAGFVAWQREQGVPEVQLTPELKRPRANEIRRSAGGAVIVVDVAHDSPTRIHAQGRGVATIYRDCRDASTLTVAESISMGSGEPRWAVVRGGTSPAGGRGGIGGTVLAVLIDTALANGPIRLKVPLFWSQVAGGVLLLAAVAIDRLRLRVTHSDV
jgi:hypothetical protein